MSTNPFRNGVTSRNRRGFKIPTAVKIISISSIFVLLSYSVLNESSKKRQAENSLQFLDSIKLSPSSLSSSSSSWCHRIDQERTQLNSDLHITYPCTDIPPNTQSAIVTYLTAGVEEGKGTRTVFTGKEYIDGALALGASLSQYLTREDTVKLILVRKGFTLPDTERIKLEKVGWIVGQAPPVDIDDKYVPRFARYKTTYTKISAIGLSEFDCVLLMDADTLVVGNIDDLLSCNVFRDDQNNKITDQYQVAGTLDYYHKKWYHFNTGSILWNTSSKEMNRVYDLTKDESFMTRFESDQIFLNTVYPDRTDVNKNELMLHEDMNGPRENWGRVVNLGWKYNVQTHVEVQHPTFWKDHFEGIKIVHYTEKKGWQCPEQYGSPPSNEVMANLKNCSNKNRDELCFCGLGYLWWDNLKLANKMIDKAS